jgi:dihydroorotase
MRFRIVNGRVVDPATGLDAVTNLYIEKDRIVGVGSPPAGFAASRTIGATGKWVIPGLVDLAARLREPGQEHKATIESETRAAASGGITSLTCPPDTKPVVDSPPRSNSFSNAPRTPATAASTRWAR